ncbi:bifunctional diaminohydroxyphosphoribosylaminopyrimidine deaminase/5-amino-6-(5-phosphoribosylamino)uracil reductase RibD [Paraferrimonas sedimenticola]|uniref:Riboflavin biosynthesis protein RibD n=1 Tax=Paraferrimonas sedimenticola TaxID=375674 RepID=A0AA37W1K0_9GAMM|nr:bifunctional diaminohydroxyphosphoribosylaminopyrimidine deaminase/5-amino-6-(5-phosphoribosylamino)uracil reductase RibD [Paraferrimonas sedimenticola]GLP96883.1 riboflavin biosynthesis protein RibD [Paraferrimonas sedimenticola]
MSLSPAVTDTIYMQRAIRLARKGRYSTSPNPRVGCVIVKNQKVVGEGYHIAAGGPHAEVHALKAAGANAQGATAYVTLEPCSHFGRTPPCAQALIKAKVARVVIAMQDPNPQVAGRGNKMLEEAGIEVVSGVLEAQAKALNPGFIKRMLTGLPYVRVKLGATQDGKTALANGQSKWITGAAARADVQDWRAQSCAVLTGRGTVSADDPSLLVRPEQWAQMGRDKELLKDLKQPLRVVLDRQAQLTPDFQMMQDGSPTLLISQKNYSEQNWPQSVSRTKLVADGQLKPILEHLAAKGINEVLVEAGATLAGAFVEQGLADELILYQADKLIGADGRNLLNHDALTRMEQVPVLSCVDRRQIGEDTRSIYRMS